MTGLAKTQTAKPKNNREGGPGEKRLEKRYELQNANTLKYVRRTTINYSNEFKLLEGLIAFDMKQKHKPLKAMLNG